MHEEIPTIKNYTVQNIKSYEVKKNLGLDKIPNRPGKKKKKTKRKTL